MKKLVPLLLLFLLLVSVCGCLEKDKKSKDEDNIVQEGDDILFDPGNIFIGKCNDGTCVTVWMLNKDAMLYHVGLICEDLNGKRYTCLDELVKKPFDLVIIQTNESVVSLIVLLEACSEEQVKRMTMDEITKYCIKAYKVNLKGKMKGDKPISVYFNSSGAWK